MATSNPTWKCFRGEPDFADARRLVQATDGEEARPRTWVALAWSDEAFLIRFYCEDREPWATMTRRDDPLYEEEALEVFLCPTEDRERYFEFEINPLGTLFDARVYNPGLERAALATDVGWDCEGLAGEVLEWPGGWTAKLTIPWASLGMSVRAHDWFAANFYRIERRPNDSFQAWSPTLAQPADFHRPLRFGTVVLSERDLPT